MSEKSRAQPTLGVCYYPEHWPATEWPDHAAKMAEAGIRLVRVGEFAWSRLEPRRGEFSWDWLDRAIATLAAANLHVILGTPTACPPKWLVDEFPEILPVGANGQPRGFGSRRHYRFSSQQYWQESQRICQVVAERYGHHPAVVAWQLDNEYGCHDTTWDYSDETRLAFHDWLKARYESVAQLNRAWGTVFWSQEYASFSEIELPVATVTEANPAHVMAFRRYASDAVVAYNKMQAEVLRANSRDDIWLTHNFMGDFTQFDHFKVGRDLDVASWDSYPLGFLEQSSHSAAVRGKYRQTGHPDWAAFHHDLYRAVGRDRFGVMEQQPGAVNWASFNAQPKPGMARLWAFEAFAHGAEFVAWFRWRQAPFAQEQMHAGLLHADGSSAAINEVKALAENLDKLALTNARPGADVALVFDYSACWFTDTQPHAKGFAALFEAQKWHSAARRLGLNINIVSPDDALSGYRLVLVPCSIHATTEFVAALANSGAHVVVGPRSGSRDEECRLPDNLAPGPFQGLTPLRIVTVDSINPEAWLAQERSTTEASIQNWRETVEVIKPGVNVNGLWYETANASYLSATVSAAALSIDLARLARRLDIEIVECPAGLRLRRRDGYVFAFNYGPEPADLPVTADSLLIGTSPLSVADVAVWQENN